MLNRQSNNEGVFQRYARDFFSPYFENDNKGFAPKVQVSEGLEGYHVLVELPGMEKNEIALTLEDNTLVIEGKRTKPYHKDQEVNFYSEFSYGAFYRFIPLKFDVDDNNILATYNNGILSVTLVNKDDGTERSRRIRITK